MLTLTKNYAVNTGQPRVITIDKFTSKKPGDETQVSVEKNRNPHFASGAGLQASRKRDRWYQVVTIILRKKKGILIRRNISRFTEFEFLVKEVTLNHRPGGLRPQQ